MTSNYIHGYSVAEQQRLLQQSQYWQDRLICPGLDYQPGDRVLEIGCAVGTTLGVLATQFPGIEVAGLDRELNQIHQAHQHLSSINVPADLKVGEAENLPWPNDYFNHVYIMWLLEHVVEPLPILLEAQRVLETGGTITLIETDYTSHVVYPLSEDYDYLAHAQCQLFSQTGNPFVGRQLGPLLVQAGFAGVQNQPVGFHVFQGMPDQALRQHVEYCLGFLEPMIPQMVQLDLDEQRLLEGLAHLQAIPDHPEGAMTTIVYRAQARKK
ncbi:methyltransferase domain-containing protein [Acaryochloris marina]|uniref:methyltransferase domain-containing protein n=1 Tax=Acaryochloris marina TaxID=155978 RepID=UPI0021C370C8|nr:methyltransferase domain-containing protein [Acaryochloris marina]BDM80613.1 methyltransferase [Acaryochloris marina MBIC10699]